MDVEAPRRVGGDEVLQSFRNLVIAVSCALAQRVGNVRGGVSRPSFAGIETHDADRIGILAREEALQHSFAVGVLLVGLSPGAARARAPKSSKTK